MEESCDYWLVIFKAELSPKRYCRGPRFHEVGGSCDYFGCLSCSRLSCLRRGSGGDRDPRRWEKKEAVPNLHCHHQNDSCIKMGSGVSPFNISLSVVGQSHKIMSVYKLQLLKVKDNRS